MYNLQLTAEQIEMRDTVREFASSEIKPAAIHPDRLQPFEKPLMTDLLDQVSQMGLRALTLSEDAGGAGADGLTTCIVVEELATGDVDIANVVATTALLAGALFDRMLSPAQRDKYLKDFQSDDRYHLAFVGRDPSAGLGWTYHRPAEEETPALVAVKQGSDWVINGTATFVANAPIAKLFAVQARTDSKKTGMNGLSSFLVPAGTAGMTVHAPFKATGDRIRWHHGSGAKVTFKDCKVPAANLLGREGQCPFADGTEARRAAPALAAVNLGVGRAAYEAAVDYAKIRRQGGRNIMEHQAIGTKLADCTIKIELARSAIWRAAWAADHPEAVSDRSLPELPLHAIARVYTAEAMHDVTLLAAECFGAMGVMRDMPLQKYVHDGFVFANSEETDNAAKLAVAESVAGYQRPLAA